MLSDHALASATLAVEQARRFLDAAELAWLAELDRRGVTEARFGQRTTAWLAHEAQLPRAVAAARVNTARKVTGELSPVGDALRGRASSGSTTPGSWPMRPTPATVDGLAGVTA